MRVFRVAAVIGVAALACRPTPGAAQTADFLAAAAAFIGEMSVAAPSCGVRERVWGVRLAYKFMGAVKDMPPSSAARLPPGTQDRTLDVLAQAQDQARRGVAANRDSFCAAALTPERLGHVDSLENGTMAFW